MSLIHRRVPARKAAELDFSMMPFPPLSGCFLRYIVRRLPAVVIAAAATVSMPVFADSIDEEEEPDMITSVVTDPDPDPELQQALDGLVRDQGLWRQVESRRLALGLLDITDLDAPRYAMLNPHEMMYAASLPKIAILLGAFVEIGDGELALDEDLRGQMVRMIRYSDNAAATDVLARVGREDLIDILTSDRLRLYDPARNGGLWVGKDYARNNAYRRDPLHNLSHGATVYQVLRFFYMLEKGELVTPRLRDDMKEILSRPGISHKFVAGLKDRPGVALFRKSGTWRDYHADAALVESGDHRFVIVGLAHHADGGKWLARLAAPMHDLVVAGKGRATDRPRVATGE